MGSLLEFCAVLLGSGSDRRKLIVRWKGFLGAACVKKREEGTTKARWDDD